MKKSFFKYWLLNQLPIYATIIYLLLPYTNFWVAWFIGNNVWIIFSYLVCEKKIFNKLKK